MTVELELLFKKRILKKLNQMREGIDTNCYPLASDQLVSLWKLFWAYQGKNMKRSFGDHFEEVGRKSQNMCLDCGEPNSPHKFCLECEKELQKMCELMETPE